MTISIEDYSWKQTENSIVIVVPLKGSPASKVDIFISKKYIKIFFNPFIFEVFFLNDINEETSKCTFANDEVIIELEKCENGHWEDLINKSLTKQEQMKIKQDSIDFNQQKLKNKQESKQKLNGELKREAVRRQINLDHDRLEQIKNLKELEKEKLTKELSSTNWKQNKPKPKIVEIFETDEELKLKNKKSPAPKTSKNNVENVVLPKVRTAGKIEVSFSNRVFPTPSRESKHEEEQEWLKKQLEARKSIGFVAEDLLPEEKDPQWLKEKGDTFFKCKNYLGAISAYSTAIKLNQNYAALYINRSAAHYALNNLQRTIEDCTTALELLQPPVDSNLNSRVRCLVRRGAALYKLSMFKEGIQEFEAALKLKPDDQQILIDLNNAKQCLN